jgi:FkbM family methyltransferase
VLAELGRSSIGPPVIRLLGVLSRRGFVSPARAGAAVTRALSLRDDCTVEIERPLDGGSGARLRLDLRYSGCLELLVAQSPGAPDVGTAALLIELARGADLVLDIGANVGLYTYLVAAAVPSVRVISFEPNPALATVVTDNVARNGWHPRVLVRAEAVGAVSGVSTLYVLSHADTEHTLDPDRIAGRDYRSIPVPVVAIDDVLAEAGAPLDRTVLKIDVEGHE